MDETRVARERRPRGDVRPRQGSDRGAEAAPPRLRLRPLGLAQPPRRAMSRSLVEIAEEFADGRATIDRLEQAAQAPLRGRVATGLSAGAHSSRPCPRWSRPATSGIAPSPRRSPRRSDSPSSAPRRASPGDGGGRPATRPRGEGGPRPPPRRPLPRHRRQPVPARRPAPRLARLGRRDRPPARRDDVRGAALPGPARPRRRPRGGGLRRAGSPRPPARATASTPAAAGRSTWPRGVSRRPPGLGLYAPAISLHYLNARAPASHGGDHREVALTLVKRWLHEQPLAGRVLQRTPRRRPPGRPRLAHQPVHAGEDAPRRGDSDDRQGAATGRHPHLLQAGPRGATPRGRSSACCTSATPPRGGPPSSRWA